MFAARTTSAVVCAIGPIALIGFAACNGPAPADSSDRGRTYPARTFHETTSFSGASFSADETRILLTSDESGTFNIYSQPLDGGERIPLTDSTGESLQGLSWFPNDGRFLYAADEGGNELHHLFVQETDGTVVDLTPGDGLTAGFRGWSADKRSFYVVTNERDPEIFDLYRYDADEYQRETMWQHDGTTSGTTVSRDGRWVATNRFHDNTDSDVYVTNLATGRVIHVTPHDGAVLNAAVTFSPDSSRLLYQTDPGEVVEIWAYDLTNGQTSVVARDDWDVMAFSFSEHGRYRVTAFNANASTDVKVVDTTNGDTLSIPGLPPGDVTGVQFSPSETKVALYLASDRSPADLWVWDVGSARPPRRLTNSLHPEIDRNDLVGSELVNYRSFDGLEIPAVLWRPHSASAENPAPAVVWVHGGPGGQTRRTYSANFQHLVNHGYAVLGVNNRGSTGYGKMFEHLDDRKHGEVDLQDCVWARTYLESLDWVDDRKIGIMGHSYGGYMVAAALTFEPEVFDVGIDIFGVTNWVRTLENLPEWWGTERQMLLTEVGDPAEDRERLHGISPLFHAQSIIRPLLVVQGANDPRVLQVESDELVEEVRANGVPVEYVLFDDEGHGFRKRENRITASDAYVRFLDTYLKGGHHAGPRTP